MCERKWWILTILTGFIFALIQLATAAQSEHSRLSNSSIRAVQEAGGCRSLQLKKPIEDKLAGLQQHEYQVVLEKGQFVHLVVEQKGVDVIVRLYAPNGKKITEVDSPNGTQGPEPLIAIAEEAGCHRVEVARLDKEAPTGYYEIRLEELREATTEDRQQIVRFADLAQAVDLSTQADELYRVGQYSEAEAKYQRALTIRERLLGDHPALANSINNLAFLYHALGNFQKALPLFQRALAIREKVQGGEHPDVAIAVNNLAALYQELGDYGTALLLYQRALAIDEKTLGSEDPGIATDLNNVATLYQAKGDYKRALPLFQRALSINEKAFGAEHPNVAISLNNLAMLYRLQSNYETAVPLYQRALAIDEKIRGQGHPVVATDLNNLAFLAKEAISTGWDCPRAEVLYSERPAKDATHIAQVIGRMVRQPLAHRIATDDALNSVTCYLPLFDRKALASIKDELEGKGSDNGENKVGPEVLRDPKLFERNKKIPAEVFRYIETLPSIPTPDSSANPLRRAKTLVRLLSDDLGGPALLADADAALSRTLNARLDGLAAEHAQEVAEIVRDIRTVDVHTSKITTTGQDAGDSSRKLETHARDMDRDTRRIINSVKEGVGTAFYAYRVHKADPAANKLDIRIEVAAILRVDGVIEEIESAATKFVREHLAKFAVEIKNTTGATRDAYRKVQEQTSTPEPITIELRANEKAATKDSGGEPLRRFQGHIFADGEGTFPAKLTDWEETVVITEIGRRSFIAWYRNPQRATANSLRIPYRDETERWSSLQVDFLIISKRDDGTLAASIVDPHGDYLADAKAKLRALADFADHHGEQFLRIQSIAKTTDSTLRVLDLLEPDVRKAVRDFEGGKITALYESKYATPYE